MEPDSDVAQLLTNFQSGGVILALSTAIMLAVRAFRSSNVQEQLPEKYRWDKLPLLVRWGFIFGTSTIASTLEAVASGKTWGAASAQAALTAFGAIFLHKETQSLGAKYDAKQLIKNPAYSPSPLRQKLKLLAPINKALFKEPVAAANNDAPKV